jgi:peptidoglycan/xylan/chitin deacetylase (PgdA/CDA1 family)
MISLEASVIPVLLYHSVTDHPLPGFERWTIDTASFARHLELIEKSGRAPLTVSDYADRLRNRTLPERPVVVTFDDGLADNLAAGRDIAARGLTATCYVVTDWIGRTGMLSDADLHVLADLGIEIGGHSHTHPRLDELRLDDVHREARRCHTQLSALLGKPVASFAYPHGNYSRPVRRIVQQAGFTSACAVRNMISHADDDPCALARLTVTAGTSQRQVRDWLDGIGRRAPNRELLPTRGYRLARRAKVRFASLPGTTRATRPAAPSVAPAPVGAPAPAVAPSRPSRRQGRS